VVANEWAGGGIRKVPLRNTPLQAPGHELAEGVIGGHGIGQQASDIFPSSDGRDDEVTPGGHTQVCGEGSASAASRRASITASSCGMGTAGKSDDPLSHARTVFSVTPQAVANLARLIRAERRAERNTAPATGRLLAVVWCVGCALRASEQFGFAVRLLRREEAVQ
jgi:hypothetical protein